MHQRHRRNECSLPPAGGGPPIVSVSGRITNPTRPSAPASITLTLTVDAEAEAAGREVVGRVRAACDADDHESLSTLVVLFSQVVARVPEFHALMDELVRNRDEDTIRKICRVPGGRGRPRGDEFYFVAAVEQLMKDQKLEQVTDALEQLAKAFKEARESGELTLPFMPSQKTLQNTHSRLRDLFRLWSRSLCVPPELLTAWPWTPPGYVPEPLQFVATRLSHAIVLHPPTSTVTEPTEENQNVEVIPRSTEQPSQSDEPQ
jgi:hypothetical protein